MTDRLYYNDSFLYDFDAEMSEVVDGPRPALILDRSAFYPTSGGQIHDTGTITLGDVELSVTEVADTEDGKVVHYFESESGIDLKNFKPGTRVFGQIDSARRRDHMQQHSGQHVLSAAFIKLFDLHTVSFHMADDYCSIDLNKGDLDTPTLTKDQVEQAERLANEIVLENRPVEIRYVTREEAGKLGLRKIPAAQRDELRIIDIKDCDLSACGGTHVNQTGQIASILLRKFEKVRQGWRVEFVAGQRAVRTARRDYTALTATAALFSSHIYDVPQNAQKTLDEIRSLRKQSEQVLEELAAAQATTLLAETPEANGCKLIVRTVTDRDINFVKLLAQKITCQSSNAIVLLAKTSPQPSLIFAQSSGQPHDMGKLMKDVMAKLGGRGGGSKDLAQGGPPTGDGLDATLAETAQSLSRNITAV
jgi:alanyl-tRNA synthetase